MLYTELHKSDRNETLKKNNHEFGLKQLKIKQPRAAAKNVRDTAPKIAKLEHKIATYKMAWKVQSINEKLLAAAIDDIFRLYHTCGFY